MQLMTEASTTVSANLVLRVPTNGAENTEVDGPRFTRYEGMGDAGLVGSDVLP